MEVYATFFVLKNYNARLSAHDNYNNALPDRLAAR